MYPDEDAINYFKKQEEIRKYCIDIFYKKKRYSIDMEEFSKVVEENKDALEKVCNYQTLKKYISPITALNKVYTAVKNKIVAEYFDNELSQALIDELVEYEKSEVYRKAKNHINYKLSLICSSSDIRPFLR